MPAALTSNSTLSVDQGHARAHFLTRRYRWTTVANKRALFLYVNLCHIGATFMRSGRASQATSEPGCGRTTGLIRFKALAALAPVCILLLDQVQHLFILRFITVLELGLLLLAGFASMRWNSQVYIDRVGGNGASNVWQGAAWAARFLRLRLGCPFEIINPLDRLFYITEVAFGRAVV